MKTLLLMRHSKSNLGEKVKHDWDRSLSKRGKKNVSGLGKVFVEENLVPQLILSSAARRARETCEILVETIHYRGDIYYLNSLYQGEAEQYLQEVRRISDAVDTVLLIGHNPGLQTFYQMLSWDFELLRTSNLACIQFPIDSWKDLDFNCTSEDFAVLESRERLAFVKP